MDVKEKHTARWLIIASAICAGLALFLYFPFLIPVITVIIWLKFRGSFAMVPYIVYLGVTYMMGLAFSLSLASLGFSTQGFPLLFTVLFICLTFPPTIVSVLAHRSGRRMYESVLQTTMASFFGIAAFVALIYVLTDQSITNFLLSAIEQVLNTNQDFVDFNYSLLTWLNQNILGATSVGVSTTDAQRISYIFEYYNEVLPLYLGNMMVSFALLSGLLSYYLPYLFLKNKDVKLTPSPAFKDLTIPNPERIILVIAFLAVSLVSMNSAYNIQVIARIVRSAIILVFSIQGISFLFYLYKAKRIGLAFLIILLTMGLAFTVLFWFGLFESMMKMRKRIDMMQNGGGE
ncbi:MAG: DUF2232 domain-containing protein [Eubacteriales bacterium]